MRRSEDANAPLLAQAIDRPCVSSLGWSLPRPDSSDLELEQSAPILRPIDRHPTLSELSEALRLVLGRRHSSKLAATSHSTFANLGSSELPSNRRRSRGTVRSPSPPLSRNVRYNPSRDRSKKSKSSDSDDDDDFQPVTPPPHETGPSRRREEIRRQRIESEQRRRDELREGFRRLKDSLPVSNQKSSKASLLDRATTYIKYLEMTQSQLSMRLQQAESETQRLRR